jgi:sugar phosphate isomerase/epimerase
MEDDSPAACHKLKQLAFEEGVAITMFSIHQDFVTPDAAERKKMIEHTTRSMDRALELGTGAIRLNSGRWKTIASFDDLMKVKGDEPPLPGYTTEDAFKWCIDSVQQCLEHADKTGITMAMENHWGLTTNVDHLLEIVKRVNSPYLRVNLDCGNFPGEPYTGITKLAPHAAIVHAKTYPGGGVWYTLDIDYHKIAAILANAGYKGYVSLEMEGNEPAATAVPKSYRILRDAFGA